MRDRIRVEQWHDDDPYPRATVQAWPDEPGDAVTGEDIGDVEDPGDGTVRADRLGAAGLAAAEARTVGGPEPGDDAGKRLYALAARIPLGEADRYSVVSAPSAAARVVALETRSRSLAALIEFQLAGNPPGVDQSSPASPVLSHNVAQAAGGAQSDSSSLCPWPAPVDAGSGVLLRVVADLCVCGGVEPGTGACPRFW